MPTPKDAAADVSSEESLRLLKEWSDCSATETQPEVRFGSMVTRSPAMYGLFARLARIAPTDSAVLIQGETGTGKELIAQTIHENSLRAGKPYVIVDCASLPESLVEAELFGHARGAFTGAQVARPGAFEAADGGTLVLDEVGELTLSVQPRLLRVLESRTVRRLGENHYRPVNVRIVSATHRDLQTMVQKGAFREDLYFRLAVFDLAVPPLRERKDDIPLLVRSLLGDAEPNDQVLTRLASRPWLGNVRELRNFLERARTFGFEEAEREFFGRGVDPPVDETTPSSQPPASLPESLAFSDNEEDFRTFRLNWQELGERIFLKRMIARYGRNVPALARAANVDRTYIYRLMRRHRM
ncbi:sigma-54 interaction domain-containing protein [Hyalangium versicolor]|uniref:sigma-54 interaction domain-containing protein n=1 Tax=Hyalangium versicolor TaxID=2861190 RepID=UPI001CCA44C0|nr:sigma-54 dependent transcriptional regulator [Hyalangium versicolor]